MARSPYVNDARTREARKRGYPARSVFKLEEIDRRFRVLRPGQRVLDLGCAPGSWSLFAARKAGRKGLVVGIDSLHTARRTGKRDARRYGDDRQDGQCERSPCH